MRLDTSRTPLGCKDSRRGPSSDHSQGGGKGVQTVQQTTIPEAAPVKFQEESKARASCIKETTITAVSQLHKYSLMITQTLSNRVYLQTFPVDPQSITAPVGGRLHFFKDNLAKLTQDDCIIHVVTGYQPEFLLTPPLHRPSRQTPTNELGGERSFNQQSTNPAGEEGYQASVSNHGILQQPLWFPRRMGGGVL